MFRFVFILLLIVSGIFTPLAINAQETDIPDMLNEADNLQNDTLKIVLLNRYYEEHPDILDEEKYSIIQKALNTSIEIRWQKGMAITYKNMGHYYLQLQKTDSAFYMLDKALEIARTLGERHLNAEILFLKGKSYLVVNNVDTAKVFLEKSLQLAIRISDYALMRDNYKSLSHLMYQKQDFEKAYNYLSAYEKLIDSLYINELKAKIVSIQKMSSEAEKENRIEMLTKENYYKEQLLQRNVTLLYFSIGTLIFLIIFGYTAFLIYKSREDNFHIMFEEEIRLAIIEKEKKFSDIVRLLPQIIFETNKTGYFTFVNKHCVNKTGYNEGELYLMHINDILCTTSQKNLNAWTEEEFGKLTEKEYLLKHRDGSFIPVILYINTVYFDNEYFGTRGIVFDISDRKEIEGRIIKAIISTEEKERSRFSKDLHDTLGPLLSTLKLYINELGPDTNENHEKNMLLVEINIMINDAIAYSREISHNLTPLVLKDYGLWKSIAMFVNKINCLNKTEIIFKSKDENKRYATFFEINIYRIVLELIQNSVKHSNANSIVIDISDNNNVFRINYYDNGKGFNFSEALNKSDGMGLFNILSRIKTLKGVYTVQTSLNEGFTFVMTCSSEGQISNTEPK